MKSVALTSTHYFLWTALAGLIAILPSCTKSSGSDQIKVGMTYDEVENLLGKPVLIKRGATELKLDVDELTLEELSLINPRINPNSPQDEQNLEIRTAVTEIIETQIQILKDTTKTYSSKWAAPHHLQTTGQLIYVTWVYKDQQIDTNYVAVKRLRSGSITDTISLPHYFVNDREVSKRDYDLVGEFVYRHPDGSIITKSLWQSYKSSGLYQVPEAERARKKVSHELKLKTESRDFVESGDKKYYVVDSRFSVIFDSASGRVVSRGYHPILVMPMAQ